MVAISKKRLVEKMIFGCSRTSYSFEIPEPFSQRGSRRNHFLVTFVSAPLLFLLIRFFLSSEAFRKEAGGENDFWGT